MATCNGRTVLVSLITVCAMLAPMSAAQAQGKSGANSAAQDAQSPAIKNLSTRGSIAKVPGTVQQTRNLSARGSLAQVAPTQKIEPRLP